MATLTISEERAQRLGFPATACGYGPNDVNYWADPSLHWANALLNPAHHGLDPEACAREIATLLTFPHVWNENMVPRFPHGTWLAGKKLLFGDLIQPGDVLLWWEGDDAYDCPTLSRVVEHTRGVLRLQDDNGGHERRLLWWKTDDARPVYRVTHYVYMPYVG